jgi:hypothetical protein
MSALDDYRKGYEQGREDARDGISLGTSVLAQGLLGGMNSDAYNKGLRDGRDGSSFDPPDDDD